jgi:hypothetical protein
MNDNSLNPFRSTAVAVGASTALVAVEQQRAIAEVQAAMIVARSNPRDPARATDLILDDCTRPALAEGALYEYSRGGSVISAPSIRLAEVVARRWGNIDCGVKELSRRDGYSECEAYAWDIETNFKDKKIFQVRHWRDTKQGGRAVTDERDIYELVANMGARRKRACIIAIIPGDVIDAAVNQCEKTLKIKTEITPELIEGLLERFSEYGVTKEMIEKRIQRHINSITPTQALQMKKIHTSLKDGMSDAADWFDAADGAPKTSDKPKTTDTAKPKQGVEALKNATKRAPSDVADPNPADKGTPPKVDQATGETTSMLDDLRSDISIASSAVDRNDALLELDGLRLNLLEMNDANKSEGSKLIDAAVADVKAREA